MKINLRHLYYEILRHIESVDFSKLWNGFKPLKFALYDSEDCFFDGKYITKTDDFLANTSIFFNGEMIAIWNVSEESDSRILASKLIHEMFHGFQRQNNESRFPDEIDALYNYKYDDKNLSLKLKENKILAELLDEFDADKFELFLKIRKLRQKLFPYEYRYEACTEQIEGSSEFVELNALKQLSQDSYEKMLNMMKKRICDENNLIPIRIISYDIGALLLFVLTENAINYEDGFSSITFSEALSSNAEEYDAPITLTMNCVIDSYYKRARAVIEEALAKNDVVSDSEHEILGVNVYNAVYCDTYIITRYFVMYGDMNNPTVQYGDFLIETKANKRMSKLYRI